MKMNREEIKKLIDRVNKKEKCIYSYTPYSVRLGREADFEVRYEFDIDPELKGLKPGQGMRCDFLYDGDDPKIDGVHMIYPEFLDEDKRVITDKRAVPKDTGYANMWIILPKSKEEVHKQRIKVGTKGKWVAGSYTIANVTVTKLLSLKDEG